MIKTADGKKGKGEERERKREFCRVMGAVGLVGWRVGICWARRTMRLPPKRVFSCCSRRLERKRDRVDILRTRKDLSVMVKRQF